MYDRKKCVAYAKKWAYSHNPEYYDFTDIGGDCTNFVSQCIYAGGKKMNYYPNGWYYISLNSRAPAWTGVEEFWAFGIENEIEGFHLRECDKNELEIGDIVQLGNGNRFYHNLLVTEVKEGAFGNRIFVSAHDFAAFNAPLSSYDYAIIRFGKIS